MKYRYLQPDQFRGLCNQALAQAEANAFNARVQLIQAQEALDATERIIRRIEAMASPAPAAHVERGGLADQPGNGLPDGYLAESAS